MPAEHDQNLYPVQAAGHIEGLTSVSDRSAGKKQQQQKRRGKGKSKKPIDEQLQNRENEEKNKDGHIDFCA